MKMIKRSSTAMAVARQGAEEEKRIVTQRPIRSSVRLRAAIVASNWKMAWGTTLQIVIQMLNPSPLQRRSWVPIENLKIVMQQHFHSSVRWRAVVVASDLSWGYGITQMTVITKLLSLLLLLLLTPQLLLEQQLRSRRRSHLPSRDKRIGILRLIHSSVMWRAVIVATKLLKGYGITQMTVTAKLLLPLRLLLHLLLPSCLSQVTELKRNSTATGVARQGAEEEKRIVTQRLIRSSVRWRAAIVASNERMAW
jgi:hypothetical protein